VRRHAAMATRRRAPSEPTPATSLSRGHKATRVLQERAPELWTASAQPHAPVSRNLKRLLASNGKSALEE
jgi:hypothetical protein